MISIWSVIDPLRKPPR